MATLCITVFSMQFTCCRKNAADYSW
eukprot:SAG31_NODE_31011_length_373_cov_1.120438_2_plen_25_part_01